MADRLPPVTPSTRTLKKKIKSEKILFDGEEWRQSFERYVQESKKRHFLKERIVFIDTWIKVMQEQMNRGVLDPHFAYDRTKKISHIHPKLNEAFFIRGIVISHWKYGADLLRMTTDSGNEAWQAEELEDLKRRYFFSKAECDRKYPF